MVTTLLRPLVHRGHDADQNSRTCSSGVKCMILLPSFKYLRPRSQTFFIWAFTDSSGLGNRVSYPQRRDTGPLSRISFRFGLSQPLPTGVSAKVGQYSTKQPGSATVLYAGDRTSWFPPLCVSTFTEHFADVSLVDVITDTGRNNITVGTEKTPTTTHPVEPGEFAGKPINSAWNPYYASGRLAEFSRHKVAVYMRHRTKSFWHPGVVQHATGRASNGRWMDQRFRCSKILSATRRNDPAYTKSE